MTIAYFDCFSGASGDMIVGALLSAGLPLKSLERQLTKLRLPGYTLSARKVKRAGFAATKFTVRLRDLGHEHQHGRHHRDRNLPDILKLIGKSGLSDRVKLGASKIFERLAKAEAAAHGKPIRDIHFHEVGAVDSIIDIVGSVAALELHGIERVHCSDIPVGHGTVRCAHGVLPVPAPATAALLKGVPLRASEIHGELTTPTGAAILTALAQSYGPLPAMKISAIGVGAGTADRPELPNLLRVFIGQTASTESADEVAVIETNIDDMPAELCGYLFDRLLNAGALDVFTTPIQMKKSRPALLLTAIAAPHTVSDIQRAIFQETSTFGLRVSLQQRRKLERSWHTVTTPYGNVRIKLGRLDGKLLSASPEYEDCRTLAERKKVPLREVYGAAQSAARRIR